MDPNDTVLLERTVDCIARTTRYPKHLLTPEADLEDDLGIDSVKQAELTAALSSEFGVTLRPPTAERPTRTIRDVVREIRAALPPAPVVAAPTLAPTPAPTPLPSHPSPARADRSTGPLEGRVALVTGSGRGLGRAIATLLAERGATVVINAFHSREDGEATAQALALAGHRALALWGSVANEDHVEAMFDRIDRDLGGLDILVCNASDGRLGAFGELTARDWDRAFRTNVAGHFDCAMRARRSMEARGGGSIVTMSTVGAHRYVRGFGSQGVVKAAVEAMTRYLACELAPSNVRVNCVAAGPIYGSLLEKFTDETAIPHWEAITPGGALCTEDEVARAVAFLVSDDAEAFNGSVVTVDRGMSSHVDGRLESPAPLALAAAIAGRSS